MGTPRDFLKTEQEIRTSFTAFASNFGVTVSPNASLQDLHQLSNLFVTLTEEKPSPASSTPAAASSGASSQPRTPKKDLHEPLPQQVYTALYHWYDPNQLQTTDADADVAQHSFKRRM